MTVRHSRVTRDLATPDMLTFFRKREGWAEAVTKLKNLAEQKGDAARGAANVNEGRRGAMVFDVVVSRQRKHKTRVFAGVSQGEEAVSTSTLSSMASTPLKAKDLGGSGFGDVVEFRSGLTSGDEK